MNRATNYTLAPRDVSSRMCGCIGPQDGNPRCPCMMQNMRQVNGRWVEVIDHGPVHERYLTDEEQRTFAMALRASGTVKQLPFK